MEMKREVKSFPQIHGGCTIEKDLGVKPYLFPMPTLMIATYNEDGTADSIMMAWGGICAGSMVALNLEKEHKTCKNLQKRMAFTISVPDIAHLKEADFLGIASANKMPDKFERSGLHAERSQKVDAPIVTEFPLAVECKVVSMEEIGGGYHVLGETVGVLTEESVLDEQGKVDAALLHAFVPAALCGPAIPHSNPYNQGSHAGSIIPGRNNGEYTPLYPSNFHNTERRLVYKKPALVFQEQGEVGAWRRTCLWEKHSGAMQRQRAALQGFGGEVERHGA